MAENSAQVVSKFAELPVLGVGIGYRDPLRSDIFRHRQQIDFLEIIADDYLDASPKKLRELELLRGHFAVIPHAINLSLGSAEGMDVEYIRKLAALIDRIDPPWWSEHVAFTRADGVDIGHLTPLPWTQESIDTVCRNVEQVRRSIKSPLVLENISYSVTFPDSEMDEPEFITEVSNQAECGLLLDVTNLHTNATNHDFDPLSFLQRLPQQRIVQLHFAGGHWHQGALVDSHSSRTELPVMELIEAVLSRAAVRAASLERDRNFSPFEDLLDEMIRVRQIGRACNQWT